MRGLSVAEHEELIALSDELNERTFHTIEALLVAKRAEEFDHAPDGTYRMRPTELGRLALRLWPLILAFL
jgi:hypothetical protein